MAAQPRGTQQRAMWATGLAYTTVIAARTKRVTKAVAEALSAFTDGAVSVDDMVVPPAQGRVRPRRAA